MISRQRYIPCINESGETAPAYGACEVTEFRQDGTAVIRKPDRDDSPSAWIIGSSAIPDNAGGLITFMMPSKALLNDDDGEPANGESLGTRAGYWQLHRGYEGFLVWGVPDPDDDPEGVVIQRDLTCRGAGEGSYYGYQRGPAHACGCNLCCDLLAQVQFGEGGGANPSPPPLYLDSAWGDATEVTMSCGTDFQQSTDYRCCDVDEFGDINCEDATLGILDYTLTGGSGREPIVDGVQIGWSYWETEVWGSNEFDGPIPNGLVSATYRMVMIHTKWRHTDMSDAPMTLAGVPSLTEVIECAVELRLLLHGVDKVYDPMAPEYVWWGFGWEFWANRQVTSFTTGSLGVHLEGTPTADELEALCGTCEPLDGCIDGGYDSVVPNNYLCNEDLPGFGLTYPYPQGEGGVIYCPGGNIKNRQFMIYKEWISNDTLNTPDTSYCDQWVRCIRMMAYSDVACEEDTGDQIYFQGSFADVDLVKATWSIGCGLAGAATSGETTPLDTITGSVPGTSWAAVDYEFDADDVGPPYGGDGVVQTYTDGELKISVGSISSITYNSSYLAVYANLICGTGGNTRTYYFKTRDFSYSDATLVDPVSVFEFSGLTPFKYEDAGTPTLTCDDVTLDLSIEVKLGQCDPFIP